MIAARAWENIKTGRIADRKLTQAEVCSGREGVLSYRFKSIRKGSVYALYGVPFAAHGTRSLCVNNERKSEEGGRDEGGEKDNECSPLPSPAQGDP